ncbi:MAG: HAD-IIA family hydrolase [Magnetococcales bacterium]|nr:HAD-IIA family hydrolase [Magnetococcales bacterium]
MNALFQETRLFAFDLDGTLYCGAQVVAGALETVALLQEQFRVVYFTNNSTRSRKAIHAKLQQMGFVCSQSEVYTSAYFTARYLQRTGMERVYVIGSRELTEEIEEQGVECTVESRADALVVGLDVTFNYQKIADGLTVLRRGGRFVACNEDCSYPVEDGRIMPGCGAMVGSLRGASGREPDVVIGKPNTYMLREMVCDQDLAIHQVAVVGDSLESDVRMALNVACPAVWLHAEASKEMFGVVRVADHGELARLFRG